MKHLVLTFFLTASLCKVTFKASEQHQNNVSCYTPIGLTVYNATDLRGGGSTFWGPSMLSYSYNDGRLLLIRLKEPVGAGAIAGKCAFSRIGVDGQIFGRGRWKVYIRKGALVVEPVEKERIEN